MKIRPCSNPNYKAQLAQNRVIEIFSSSDEDDTDSDDDEAEVGDGVIVISSDDERVDGPSDHGAMDGQSVEEPMEIDPFINDDQPLDVLVSSRQSSTDREVSENDDIDLDKVRWASSDDDSEADDLCLELRGPNEFIPGIFPFCSTNVYYKL